MRHATVAVVGAQDVAERVVVGQQNAEVDVDEQRARGAVVQLAVVRPHRVMHAIELHNHGREVEDEVFLAAHVAERILHARQKAVDRWPLGSTMPCL